MNSYDLIVVGAGPGGTSAAITSAQLGAKVLLLERGSFPRHRVCGEFVSAESLDLLRGLLGPDSQALMHSALSIPLARVFLDGQLVESEIQPAAASIARFDLDRALWQAAGRHGVEMRERVTVKRIVKSEEVGFTISSTDGELHAGAVIDASGRWSNINRAILGNETRWVGIKSHFAEANPSPSVDLYFFDGGYCGVQPVPLQSSNDSRVNVCAMVKADTATSLSGVFPLHPSLQNRSRRWTSLMDEVATSPLVFRDPRPVRDDLMAVGDAAGFVDPFVGDGISLALRSGALAANCLAETDYGIEALQLYAKRYKTELAPIYRASSTLRRLLKLPSAIRKPALGLLKSSPKLQQFIVARTRRAG
jgi:flavin-dependent dehydrogenase